MDDAENYVKQNESASKQQVTNFDFHVWTLGRKKDMKVKELVLETGTGKPKKDHKWEEEEWVICLCWDVKWSLSLHNKSMLILQKKKKKNSWQKDEHFAPDKHNHIFILENK